VPGGSPFMSSTPKSPRVEALPALSTRPDEWLVAECLRGNEGAWSALIARYKRLIYSIPLKYGASPDDAADVFQAVCVEMFSELPRLRKVESLRSWLMTVTTHQAYHWKQRHRKRLTREGGDLEQAGTLGVDPEDDAIEAIERAELMQDGLRRLSPRCQTMLRLLFFREPPMRYDELARELGLATGSIGFIRGRCLKRLETELKRLGF
jgi:RNA polymerase sigma factor (sigma-70 family)